MLLIPLIERVIADVVGLKNMGRGRTLNQNTWKKVAAPTDFFLLTLWKSLDAFISQTWRFTEFAGPSPKRLNRHRSVHGWDPKFGTQADALRLFTALDLMCYLLAEMRSEEIAKKRGRK
jgi:hypothetical protein